MPGCTGVPLRVGGPIAHRHVTQVMTADSLCDSKGHMMRAYLTPAQECTAHGVFHHTFSLSHAKRSTLSLRRAVVSQSVLAALHYLGTFDTFSVFS